jgi:hypothetical protein
LRFRHHVQSEQAQGGQKNNAPPIAAAIAAIAIIGMTMPASANTAGDQAQTTIATEMAGANDSVNPETLAAAPDVNQPFTEHVASFVAEVADAVPNVAFETNAVKTNDGGVVFAKNSNNGAGLAYNDSTPTTAMQTDGHLEGSNPCNKAGGFETAMKKAATTIGAGNSDFC